VFPLFGADTTALAGEMMDAGLRATLCCVDSTQLDPQFAGRAFDPALLAALPPTVDPCGEHGEFHTCAHAGPMFRRALSLRAGERVLRDARFMYCDLELDP
jgi:diphthamide synthase (EF-2-diphthine--ammonia ligase)